MKLPSTSLSAVKFFRSGALAALFASLVSLPVHAQISALGTASGYAVLDTGVLSALNLGTSTSVTGNVGVFALSNLTESASASVTGAISGGVATTQAVLDAAAGATYYGSLSPTTTLASLGAGTITGNGGTNVYSIAGNLALSGQTLTITGTSTDQFVFNIYGAVNLTNGANIVLNGVSPSQVIFNLIGAGTKLSATGNSDTSGVFLAENGSISVVGGAQNSQFIAGGAINLQTGVSVQERALVAPAPELSPAWMAAGALAALVILRQVAPRLRRSTHSA